MNKSFLPGLAQIISGIFMLLAELKSMSIFIIFTILFQIYFFYFFYKLEHSHLSAVHFVGLEFTL